LETFNGILFDAICSYPLSAPFGVLLVAESVLIWINDDTMTPTENVHCRFRIYSVS